MLLEETVEFLRQGGPGLYLDGTLGAGGHSRALLESFGDARILGLDQDSVALDAARETLSPFAQRVLFHKGNFRDMEALQREFAPEGFRGVLLDLGLSSLQIDEADRGFTYQQDAPLDMRMSEDTPRSAADLLAELDAEALQSLLSEFGEVRHARRISRAIVEFREQEPLLRSSQLRRAIESAVPAGPKRTGEVARVFQALRISVNGELEALDEALECLPRVLAEGGLAVLISYHSLEDRRVKQSFQRGSLDCLCPPSLPVCACDHKRKYEILTPRPRGAGEEEIRSNPRARSARLRVARRIAQ